MANDVIASVLTDLLRVAILAAAGFVAAAIRHYAALLRGRMSDEQLQRAQRIAGIVVSAAEQVAAASGATMAGKQKLDWALGAAQQLAEKAGLDLTEDQWRALIEEAVKDLKAAGQEIKAAAAPLVTVAAGGAGVTSAASPAPQS